MRDLLMIRLIAAMRTSPAIDSFWILLHSPFAPMHPYDARQLAWDLIRRHGLADAGWRFEFACARRRFGCCHYARKLITLSRPLTLLNAEAEVRDTLLHEIAHALTPGQGHGPRWRAKCRELGAKPVRCYRDDSIVSPPRRSARYEWGCRACGWWVARHRRTRRRFVCARCSSSLTYRQRGPSDP